MPTVKELKYELDKREVKYPANALKADLEILLLDNPKTNSEMIENMIVDPPFLTKIEIESDNLEAKPQPDGSIRIDFIDPNANPETQA